MRFLAILILSSLAFADDPADQMARELKKLVDVFATVESDGAEPVAAETAFFQGAIPGMLKTLDPHSIFFDPGQYEQLKQMEKSENTGFGTIVSVLPGRVIVLQTAPGSPSAKAGLSAGDEILAINGYVLARLEFDQLVQLLGAARQHEAVLDIRRPGNARLTRIMMTPAVMDAPSVDRSFMLAPGIGYLRVTSFDQKTAQLIRDTIENLGGANLKGLVMDLRDNPGGVAQAALETASLFLKPDQLIFSVRGRAQKTEDVRVPKENVPYTFPVAILINGKTASASEIVTGALQDHDRASVFGQPSYGKGLVQNVFPLSSNTGVALTVAFYYTPSGRSIQHPLEGSTLEATAAAMKGLYHTDSGREVHGGGGIEPDEVVWPAQPDRLAAVLDASGSLTSFAGEYVRAHKIEDNFEATPEVLDELKVFLSARSIQPGVGEWLSHRDWIQSRVKQEVLTMAFGVARGDQIEMQRDPVVQHALEKISQQIK
jgi:carboxyl-terminal processing protease